MNFGLDNFELISRNPQFYNSIIHTSVLIYLYGEDTFSSRQKLKQLKDKFLKEVDPSGVNLVVLDGEKINIDQFNQAVLSVSFLSRRRMVVIENLLKSKDKKMAEAVAGLIDKESVKDNILVFWEDQPADSKSGYKKKSPKEQANPLIKKLLKEKYVYRFQPLNESQLHKWVNDEVKQSGLEIDNQAVKLLISYVGGNLWQLDREVKKLISYARAVTAKTILADYVQLLVPARYDDNIFNLIDALSQKNKKRASRLLRDQLDSGQNEMYLLTMIVRQFKILLQVKEILDKKPGYGHLASLLRIHPFVAQKAAGASKNFSLTQLKNIYQKLLEIDFKIKTGWAKPELLLDLLVVGL